MVYFLTNIFSLTLSYITHIRRYFWSLILSSFVDILTDKLLIYIQEVKYIRA